MVGEDAAAKARRLPLSEPGGKAPGAPAYEPFPFKTRKPRLIFHGAAVRLTQRNNLGNRLIPVQHQHRLSTPHIVQVAGEVVFQIRNLGFLHMAVLAILEISVNAAPRNGRDAQSLSHFFFSLPQTDNPCQAPGSHNEVMLISVCQQQLTRKIFPLQSP
ncbi:MAG: hypothetical protein A2044_08080 [Candidatus Firestonebacteria bacterium GWA2_43_8]|nr:MAG: hypothetical protein A2044_08080 [Candidatus Firestonebacteria bacterium GWA2_43_8]